MGNTTDLTSFNQNDTKSVQTDHSYLNVEDEDYYAAFDMLQLHHQHFFKEQFLHECPNFGRNLQLLFPNAINSPEEYVEMVSYLRKYEVSIVSNKKAQQNSEQSTLLDRFFMLCMGNLTYLQYKQTKVSRHQIELLLLDYYRLFVTEPKIHSAVKVLKFIDSQDLSNPEEMISVQRFAEKLREYFPHVHRYLRDYYFAKFHNAEENFRILKHFKSEILAQDAVILALKLSELQKPSLKELYNSDDFGTGFYMLEKRIVGYSGPWMMLVKHREKNMQFCYYSFRQGKIENYVFGTYQNGPITQISGFQGDVTGFMFTLEPTIRFMYTNNGDGGQKYFTMSTGDERITKRRKGIGFGGDNELKNFKLWIDEDMDKSTVYNGYDQTYGFGPLAGQATQKLTIERIEVWALGSEENLRDHEIYLQERSSQILKMRKVKRNEFLTESEIFLGMYLGYQKLGNVFAHRDQVGQVEQPNKKKQPIYPQNPYRQTVTFKGKQNQNPIR